MKLPGKPNMDKLLKCIECGADFISAKPNALVCSIECRKKRRKNLDVLRKGRKDRYQ